MRWTCIATLLLAWSGIAGYGIAAEEDRMALIGGDLAAWRQPHGQWQISGDVSIDQTDERRLAPAAGRGAMFNGPPGRTNNLLSQDEFGDAEVHVEFLVPKGSNSGVYLQARYEVQILDSWQVAQPTYTDCGGIYQRWADGKGFEGHGPRINASLPPGRWQTFDIVFRAPRFDPQGNKVQDARFIRVLHNGKLVHENVDVTGPTRASTYDDEKAIGPLMLQGDHGPVAFRNLWIRKIQLDGSRTENATPTDARNRP